MRKQISSISIKQSSKFIAVLYFILSAIFLIPFGIFTMIQGQVAEGALLLLVPFLYALLTFIVFAIMAFIYNLVADMVGGLEFTIKDIG